MKKYLWLLLAGFVISLTIHALYAYVTKPKVAENTYKTFRLPEGLYSEVEKFIKTGDDHHYYRILGTMGADRMPYIILMAHHFQYPKAYDDFYFRYLDAIAYKGKIRWKPDTPVDSASIKMTMDFLWAGTSYKCKGCFLRLCKIYREGIYVEKDSAIAQGFLNDLSIIEETLSDDE